MTEEYHEVFVPHPDVFDVGGPEVFSNFERKEPGERNLIVIPMAFVEQLERIEKDENSMGATESLEFIMKASKPQFRVSGKDDLVISRVSQGLDIGVVYKPDFLNQKLKMTTLEKFLRRDEVIRKRPITFITNVNSEHIRLNGAGLNVEEPTFLQVTEDIVYQGIISGNAELESRLYSSQHQRIPADEAMSILERELYMNQFIRFKGEREDNFAVVAGQLIKNSSGTRVIGVKDFHVHMLPQDEHSKNLHFGDRRGDHYKTDNILGVAPMDMEQYLALQYGLIPPDISIFFICGKRGSGKTLLSYAYAIDSILIYDSKYRALRGLQSDRKEAFFKQIALLKPPEILGGKRRDLGALPGDLYHKLKPHLRPYMDAHKETSLYALFAFEDLLRHPKRDTDFGPARSKEVNELKINEIAHLSPYNEAMELIYSGYIGGGSVADTLFIIDEAQDFTPYELKTILERLSKGSAAIVCGDPRQVRNPKCSLKRNGLTYSIKHYLPKNYSGLVYLSRNYRHQISEDTEEMRVYND